MNIDMLTPTNAVTKEYQSLLDMFDLHQMIKEPTRTTRTSKTIIDHIVVNSPSSVTASGVIPCSIVSDHDGVYACVNTRVPQFKPRYKYIRNTRTFDRSAFINDFQTIPFVVAESFDDPDDQLQTINKLFNECLERHCPLIRTRVTRPPAPWMRTPNIENLKLQRDKLREEAHSTKSEDSWRLYRSIRNALKVEIRSARKSFMENALSSRNSRDVWKIIHRILKPNPKPLRVDLDDLN